MSDRHGRKPEITALAMALVAAILAGDAEAVEKFITYRSDDHKQLPAYMSLPELQPLWDARDRLPYDLIRFIEPWVKDDGVRRRQNSVAAKKLKAEERQALLAKAETADLRLEVLRGAHEGICGAAANLAGVADGEADYLHQLADYIAGAVPEVLPAGVEVAAEPDPADAPPAEEAAVAAAEDERAWEEGAPTEEISADAAERAVRTLTSTPK